MASRAALRVLPLAFEFEPSPDVLLATMRAIFTSRAAAVGVARKVESALESANRSAAGVAATAKGSARSQEACLSVETAYRCAAMAVGAAHSIETVAVAARAAQSFDDSIIPYYYGYTTRPSANSFLKATYAAFSVDAAAVDAAEEWGQVWAQQFEPDEFRERTRAFLQHLEAWPHWEFWARWFKAVWNGRELDDALVVSVALIEDTFWRKGAKAVAKEIKGLENGPLPVRQVFEEDPSRNEEAARLPTEPAKQVIAFTKSFAPPLGLRETAPEFFLRPEDVGPLDLMQHIRDSLGFTIEFVVNPERPNALRDDSQEVLLIRQALRFEERNAQLIALALIDARRMLEQHLSDGTYPPDGGTDMLRARLVQHVDELADANDIVAKRIEGYDGLPKPSAPTAETIADLIKAVSEFEDTLDPELREAFLALAETLRAGEVPPKGAMATLTNWWTTIGIHVDTAKKDEARVSWLVKMILRLWDLWPGGGP